MVRDGREDDPPKRLWRFDPAGLVAGDVVLERGPGRLSKLIMWVDGGNYSHALLWLGGTDFLEAVGTGVRVISFARVLVSNPDDWLMLRLPGNPVAAAEAVTHARNMAHKLYDRVGAISTKIPLRDGANPIALFCSQLVATAYEMAGIQLVAKVPASKVTPNMLHQRSVLVVMAPTPLVELDFLLEENEDTVQFYMDRDKAYTESHMQREMEISQEAFHLVRPMYDGITLPKGCPIGSPPGNLSDAIALLQVIDMAKATQISDKLTAALDAGGYFNFLDQPLAELGEQLFTYQARLKLKLADVDEARYHADRLKVGMPGRREAQQRHANNAAICKDQVRQRGLEIFKRHHQMYATYAAQLEIVANLEDEIHAECVAFLKAAGDVGTP